MKTSNVCGIYFAELLILLIKKEGKRSMRTKYQCRMKMDSMSHSEDHFVLRFVAGGGGGGGGFFCKELDTF